MALTESQRAYQRKWKKNNYHRNPKDKAQRLAYSRKWNAANKEHKREYDKRRRIKSYGLTLEQYEKALERQGGACGLCFRVPKRVRLAIDHDHKTGRVRGLLCWLCNNRLLGRSNEDPELHLRAYEYLRSTTDLRFS